MLEQNARCDAIEVLQLIDLMEGRPWYCPLSRTRRSAPLAVAEGACKRDQKASESLNDRNTRLRSATARQANDEISSNAQMKKDLSDTPFRHSDLVIPSSLGIRHSSFLNPRAGGNYKAPAFAQLRRGRRMTLTRPGWRMSQVKPIMLTGECNAVHDDL